MAYEQREGSGVLFKNDKGGNEKRPDYRGSITINGTELELSAWIKEGRKGKFMSLSAQPKRERRDTSNDAQREAAASDLNDDVPFAHAWIALPLVGLLVGAAYAAQYIA